LDQFRPRVDSSGRSEFYNYNYYTIINLKTLSINKKKLIIFFKYVSLIRIYIESKIIFIFVHHYQI